LNNKKKKWKDRKYINKHYKS